MEGNERAREGRGLEEGGDGTGEGGLGWGGQGGQEQRSDGELKARARAGERGGGCPMGKGCEDPRGGSGRGKVWEGWWGRKNWARGSGRWGVRGEGG